MLKLQSSFVYGKIYMIPWTDAFVIFGHLDVDVLSFPGGEGVVFVAPNILSVAATW